MAKMSLKLMITKAAATTKLLNQQSKVILLEPDPTPMRTLIGIVELTSENQADYFEDFIKKEGHRYYLNEVTVNGFSTEMSGDIEDGEVI